MNRSGFSLVELSIVLVILGLLVGGILGGQSLIRAAELRKIGKDVEQLTTAVNSFRLRFNALPGDMPNATAFWGTDAGGCTIRSDATPKQETCNGNNNGLIEAYLEAFRANQHLANAGLIAGQYSGSCVNKTGFDCTSNYYLAKSGVNMIPSGENANSGYIIFSQYTLFGSSAYTPGGGYHWGTVKYNGVIWFGNSIEEVGHLDQYFNIGDGISAEDAGGIDRKFDDGKPAYGKIVTAYVSGGCFSAAAYPPKDYPESAIYNNTNFPCPLIFLAF